MKNKTILWSKYYKESEYKKNCEKFCHLLETVQIDYKNLPDSKLKNITLEYSNFWEKTIELCSIFLHNNAIFVENNKECIVCFIYTGVIQNGKTFYQLYRGMQNLKKKEILPEKYFQKKYITLFYELNNFFIERTKKEANYDLVS